jgi:hypothetical protein
LRSVLFMDESRFQLYQADGRQCVWCCVCKRFADVNIVNRVPHCGSGVVVWEGLNYGQQTYLHFIDGNLNAQRYRDEILKPIVVPFFRHHRSCFSMIMHGPMSKGFVHNLWKLKMPQFFHGLHTQMSPIEHVWNALDQRVRQRCSSSCQYPHQILTGFLIHAPTFCKVSGTNKCISVYSQSCEIDRLGSKEFPYRCIYIFVLCSCDRGGLSYTVNLRKM